MTRFRDILIVTVFSIALLIGVLLWARWVVATAFS